MMKRNKTSRFPRLIAYIILVLSKTFLYKQWIGYFVFSFSDFSTNLYLFIYQTNTWRISIAKNPFVCIRVHISMECAHLYIYASNSIAQISRGRKEVDRKLYIWVPFSVQYALYKSKHLDLLNLEELEEEEMILIAK